jgi:hypothetical protein
MKLEPKSTEWVYLNERYEVCGSNCCNVIGEIYLDLADTEWVFDNKDSESGTTFYLGEMEEIVRLLNILNKRDKLGKYKRIVRETVQEESDE